MSSYQEIQTNDVAGPIRVNAGFIIIAERTNHNDNKVVLAVRPNLSEYVSWMNFRKNEFYHGHYSQDFQSAVEEFNRR